MSSRAAPVVPLLPRRARKARTETRREAMLLSLPGRPWDPIVVARPEWPGPGVGDPQLLAVPVPA